MEIDLFGNSKPELCLKIYADEAMNRKYPDTGENWHYMCLIFERQDKRLLDDLIIKRYCNNFDEKSPYYKKNNKILHWTDLNSADEKNICKRWFEYILDPQQSKQKFYCYILGLNETFLNDDEFDKNDKFGSVYNRFFRTAIEYGIKYFFPKDNFSKIVIEEIYHEQGQQQNHSYFKRHPIDKLSEKTNIDFKTDEIKFLSKDHTKTPESNILQLCDCFLGATVNLIHGLENPNSKRAKNKSDLLELLFSPLSQILNDPYKSKQIIIRFFPKERTQAGDLNRQLNQFYSNRTLKYIQDKSGQYSLF